MDIVARRLEVFRAELPPEVAEALYRIYAYLPKDFRERGAFPITIESIQTTLDDLKKQASEEEKTEDSDDEPA